MENNVEQMATALVLEMLDKAEDWLAFVDIYSKVDQDKFIQLDKAIQEVVSPIMKDLNKKIGKIATWEAIDNAGEFLCED